MKPLSLLITLVFLPACGPNKPQDASCEPTWPIELVTLQNGTTLECQRLNCPEGCVEWACKPQGLPYCRSFKTEKGS